MDAIKRPIYRDRNGGIHEFMGETVFMEIRVVVYRSVDDCSMCVDPAEEFYSKFEYVPSDER